MIKNHDRSGWFGASDANIVMTSWDTKTFARWWLEKLGLVTNTYTNKYMLAGTYFEHKILKEIGVAKTDRQIKIRRLRLRVNLDGETKNTIKEVKTHSSDVFKVSKAYWRQAQVQMFASGKSFEIVAYKMEDDDYENFYRPIDRTRITLHSIVYDMEFINNEYIPRISYLSHCLSKRETPKLAEFQNVYNR